MVLCLTLTIGVNAFASDPVDKPSSELSIQSHDAVTPLVQLSNDIELVADFMLISIERQKEITITKYTDLSPAEVLDRRWQPGNFSLCNIQSHTLRQCVTEKTNYRWPDISRESSNARSC